MVFAGMLPWTLFSSVLSEASDSVIGNANLISKVYFPRLIVPLSTVVVALIDFLVSLAILAGLMLWYGFVPGWQILLLPVFVAAGAAGEPRPGDLGSRAQRQVPRLPLHHPVRRADRPLRLAGRLLQHGRARAVALLYSLNPMVGVIDGFRWCILGGDSPIYWPGFLVSLGVIAVHAVAGRRADFRRTERAFADMI